MLQSDKPDRTRMERAQPAHRLTFHSDPFDRTIVATVRVMDLPLMTRVETIVNSNLVKIVW